MREKGNDFFAAQCSHSFLAAGSELPRGQVLSGVEPIGFGSSGRRCRPPLLPLIGLQMTSALLLSTGHSAFRRAPSLQAISGGVISHRPVQGIPAPGIYWSNRSGSSADSYDIRTSTVREQQETITRGQRHIRGHAVCLCISVIDPSNNPSCRTGRPSAVYQLDAQHHGQHDLDEVLQERDKINTCSSWGSRLDHALEVEIERSK